MIGVGIIGCGGISGFHIASYREDPDCKVVAVASASAESARRTGEAIGADWYTDYRALLKRKDVDVVSICTPSGLHAEEAIACANAGKHVVVEKPLDVTLEKIDAMIRACRENRVLLSCIFNFRYCESYRFVKQAVDAGRFGRLINCNAYVRWYRKPEYYQKSAWRGTYALDGGGALMNQSVHYVDLLQWICGGVESVMAYTGTLLHTGIEAEDTACAALRLKNGAIGVLSAGTSIYPGYAAKLEITGSRGSVIVEDGVLRSWSFVDSDPMDAEAKSYFADADPENRRASDPLAFDHRYHARQIRQTLEAIRIGAAPDVDGAEARAAVAIILAIYESARSGERVFVD